MLIRDATVADAPAITAIYNAFIPTRTTTWTEDPEAPEHRATWIERQSRDGFPVLVAEIDGEVVGFTTYEHFRGEGKWPGYRATMELSIHISEAHWGLGVGRALIEALVERALAARIHVLVAAVDSENHESLEFHARLGFTEVARMPEIGQKWGRWLDLVLMQRVLDPGSPPA
jgi:phosphinothricin acetyltransferase